MSNFNPNLTTPQPDPPIANQWWSGLSFRQQEFIEMYYNMAVGISPHTILLAYRNRAKLRSKPNWPKTKFTQI